jgi:hypothetical protein
MTNIFKKLYGMMYRTVVKYPLSKEDINQKFIDGVCPDCGKKIDDYMLAGPRGGIAQNIKCSFCGSFFNDMGPFGVDRISWFEHHSNIINKYSGYSKNYIPFNPDIVCKWNGIHLCGNEFGSIYCWCSDNCKGKWSVKAGKMNSGGATAECDNTFFFSNADEAMAFKLRWT